jgi:hypothetical protein
MMLEEVQNPLRFSNLTPILISNADIPSSVEEVCGKATVVPYSIPSSVFGTLAHDRSSV